MKKLNEDKIYYGFTQYSRMNYCNVPYGKCIEEIVFGIYVENDGCISEAAFVWEKVGDELMLYMRVFSDGITVAYSEKFKAVADEINNKDDITPQQIVELLVKHGFRDRSDKPIKFKKRGMFMSKEIHLKDTEIMGDKVKLIYQDDSELFVSKKDYDRAFGCIVSAPKADIERDFAIK